MISRGWLSLALLSVAMLSASGAHAEEPPREVAAVQAEPQDPGPPKDPPPAEPPPKTVPATLTGPIPEQRISYDITPGRRRSTANRKTPLSSFRSR